MKRQAVKIPFFVRLCLSVALAAMLSGCAQPAPPTQPTQPEPPSSPPVAEGSAIEIPPPAPLPPPSPATLPAPTPDEVQAAIARIYKDAVRVSPDRAQGFVVGDFNGDQWQDLAVVVEPVKGKLEDLNSEIAAWIISNPLTANASDTVVAVKRDAPKSRPVIGEQDTALIAIIHGYGPQGWRDPEAQQSYLLKTPIDGPLTTQARRAALAAFKATLMPAGRGAVLQASIAGAAGFLYHNGSSYAWYDPHTYRGDMTARMMH